MFGRTSILTYLAILVVPFILLCSAEAVFAEEINGIEQGAAVDLDIRSAGGEWTPDGTEIDPGVFVQVNNDDDNADGAYDYTGGQTGFEDDDLMYFRCYLASGLPNGKLELTFTVPAGTM